MRVFNINLYKRRFYHVQIGLIAIIALISFLAVAFVPAKTFNSEDTQQFTIAEKNILPLNALSLKKSEQVTKTAMLNSAVSESDFPPVLKLQSLLGLGTSLFHAYSFLPSSRNNPPLSLSQSVHDSQPSHSQSAGQLQVSINDTAFQVSAGESVEHELTTPLTKLDIRLKSVDANNLDANVKIDIDTDVNEILSGNIIQSQ